MNKWICLKKNWISEFVWAWVFGWFEVKVNVWLTGLGWGKGKGKCDGKSKILKKRLLCYSGVFFKKYAHRPTLWWYQIWIIKFPI